MKNTLYLILIVGLGLTLIGAADVNKEEHIHEHPEWGFYGHRLINKLAVFCLPQDLLKFYKKNIDFVSEHAVDPDKRRYATRHEAVRHYIDIDAWGEYPFPKLPRNFNDALIANSHYKLINQGDTTLLQVARNDTLFTIADQDSAILKTMPVNEFRDFFFNHLKSKYYEDEWIVEGEEMDTTIQLDGKLLVEDHFSQEGILPYWLLTMKHLLTQAFLDGDKEKVLRLSADYGHYIGDAHVPLHTTRNYNGQLTDQVGIHAFWESRIPELFAEAEYNFIVGKARYIDDPKDYFWKIVMDSHKLLDDVLDIEKELSKTFPPDKQYCYDERLGRTLRIQCPEYAKAYQERMNGMVEARMQDAILAIANVWYTCWTDAGQPPMDSESIDVAPEEIKRDPKLKGRNHEG